MHPSHWELAVHEHEAILNALQRRDGAGLSHILRRHLRHKREAVERAGFSESAQSVEQPAKPAQRAASG
jgi:DNA-binding GntR family transcriptional regulator